MANFSVFDESSCVDLAAIPSDDILERPKRDRAMKRMITGGCCSWGRQLAASASIKGRRRGPRPDLTANWNVRRRCLVFRSYALRADAAP